VSSIPYIVNCRQIEVDFGNAALAAKVFTVADPDVIPAHRIFCAQAGDAATGKAADENELDAFHCSAWAGTGQITINVTALHGYLVGKYKVSYMMGL